MELYKGMRQHYLHSMLEIDNYVRSLDATALQKLRIQDWEYGRPYPGRVNLIYSDLRYPTK